MGEKKSGIRDDISLDEFAERMDKVSPRSEGKGPKAKSFFEKATDFLSSFGIIPVIFKSSKGTSCSGPNNTSGNRFREEIHVNTTPQPPKPTHEDMIKAHMAHDAYMSMVDGKGDHDCK